MPRAEAIGQVFADELREAASSERPAQAVEALLRRWQGVRLSVPVEEPAAVSTARAMALAGIERATIVRRLVEGLRVSERTAHRYAGSALAQAANERRNVAGPQGTVAAWTTPTPSESCTDSSATPRPASPPWRPSAST